MLLLLQTTWQDVLKREGEGGYIKEGGRAGFEGMGGPMMPPFGGHMMEGMGGGMGMGGGDEVMVLRKENAILRQVGKFTHANDDYDSLLGDG